VRGGKSIGNLKPYLQSTLKLQWVTANQLPHVATLNVLHRYKVNAIYFVQIEDSADIWMV